METHYTILGIEVKATQVEIKKAYRKKMLEYHPDRNKSSEALEMAKKINKAFEVLSDEIQRRMYDMQIGVAYGFQQSEEPAQRKGYSQNDIRWSNFHGGGGTGQGGQGGAGSNAHGFRIRVENGVIYYDFF